MQYKRTNWKNNDYSTPLSAENMNNIEDAIVNLINEIDLSRDKETSLSESLKLTNDSLDNIASSKADKTEIPTKLSDLEQDVGVISL